MDINLKNKTLLTYNWCTILYMFKLHNLMSSDNHHHPPNFPSFPLTSPGNRVSAFLLSTLCGVVGEFYINGIRPIFLCLAIFTQCHYSETDPCWVYQESFPFVLLGYSIIWNNSLTPFTCWCAFGSFIAFGCYHWSLWTFLCESLYVNILAFLWGKYLEVEWMGHKLGVYLTF